MPEMTSSELLKKLRADRREVIKKMPRTYWRYFCTLTKAIRAIEQIERRQEEIAKHAKSKELLEYFNEKLGTVPADPGPHPNPGGCADEQPPFAGARTPLEVRKRKLVEFLTARGVATRGEIVNHTQIPAGSLSELLAGEEFVQIQRGFWGLRDAQRPDYKEIAHRIIDLLIARGPMTTPMIALDLNVAPSVILKAIDSMDAAFERLADKRWCLRETPGPSAPTAK